MTTYGFEGRVAIVTGAGRGIGRSYARLLAERGARLVVNDVGGSIEGDGTDAGVASKAADEIVSHGGEAVANDADVSTVEGARELVEQAVGEYGRIDVVVNNAGIVKWASFPELDADILERHLAVHLGGSFNTARAAWPHMVDQSYGRIVMTTSSGIFGLSNNTAYASAKAAVIGLTRSLAIAGADDGIKVNLIAPAAVTRMAGRIFDDSPAMAPDLVAPMAAFLAHESCPVSGEMYAAGFGRFARMFIATTPGYVHPGTEPTIEDVAENWAAINDEAGYRVPADLMDWSATFMAHLPDRSAPSMGEGVG